MLLVKTTIGVSGVAGIGLFADEFIPAGTLIWKFKEGFDMRFNADYLHTLNEPARSFFLTYASQNPKTLRYMLCADNARFFNHSDNPNTACVPDPDSDELMDIAAKDIQSGEELTIDYRTFDNDPFYGFKK